MGPFCLLPLVLCVVITSEAALVRKNVNDLSKEEILSLQQALGAVNADTSEYGYASLAAYHGYPAQCRHGDTDVACCLHGMTVFPQWHRLYVVQMEQLLRMKGLDIGIPYWDWTQPLTHLPDLVNEQVFMDSDGGKARPNVWNRGDIHTDHGVVHTARAVDERLFQKVSAGEHTDLFEHILDSLEYEDYCQFEVQFEVAHSTIHYLVGGRHKYSMSHLEYTSYDPIFFLHHSNVDRLLSIYEKIHDYGGSLAVSQCTGKQCERCDVRLMHEPLAPFSWESNPVNLTRVHSKPLDGTDPSDLGYSFDDMTLNGYDVEGIRSLLKERTSHDRAFASFRLFGIGTSANVKVEVCLPSDDSMAGEHCEFAGEFFLLGGPIEMPWEFTRPYYFDITKAVLRMGVPLDGNYRVNAELFSVNGTKLSSDIVPRPSVSFRPAKGQKDPFIHVSIPGHQHDIQDGVVVRKDIDSLTPEEMYELREAMQKFQNDRSVDGFQATAEFHGDPGKCPFPTADVRMACCIHGMPTFPHWHRLYVVQVEDALRRRGSSIGIPYWDWTKPATTVPALAGDETYLDPYSGETVHNPFYDADVAFLGSEIHTTRDVHPDLTQVPKFGDHTDFFDLTLLALEQDNFCDFAVQFEVSHNNIHAAVGGRSLYGLSSLSYSAYDPIFVLHHSNVDRIWAIWTALQQHRGKPYKAHCAQSYVYEPLKPFAFSSPYNNNEKTFAHSVPTNVYDYEEELGYAFDSLEFGGMGIAELDDYINTNLKGKSRTFAGIMLHGIKQSAIGTVFIHDKEGNKFDAGQLALLGGPSEMAWRFDRPYRYDITNALETVGLAWDGDYTISLELKNLDMTPVDASSFHTPQIIHTMAEKSPDATPDDVHVRKNVDRLTEEEVLELRHALANLQADNSAGGYQNLGRYHGTPKWCPSPEAETKVACCVHGMSVFPHWHRLLSVQAENALRRHGYKGALPYWDWTQPLTALPGLVNDPTYTDPTDGQEVNNPFYSAHIDDVNEDTVRSVRDDLYKQPGFGEYTSIAKQVLLALEQEDFCTFEVQYEIAHNFIHALVGGTEKYSMASLMYTAFDPLFFLHHSNTDRLWAIWQALQKYRGKPYNTANCAIGQLRKPLSPFSLTSNINPDSVTRENSIPFKVFDYRTNFHYEYDTLDFNGLSIPQLARVLEQNKEEDRVFAGFMLHGIHKSALVKFYVCRSENDCDHYAGEFYVLGDINEMEWAYDRLYKYDITDVLASLDLHYSDRYYIRYEVHDLEGQDLGQPFPTPSVVLDVGNSHLYGQEYREAVTAASQIRRDLESLNEGEVESLRAAFLAIQEDGTYENIAAFHGKPGLCERNGRKIACCVHGMPTFPAWHRLYVEQVEEALLSRGSSVAVPYWDWTKPISQLPALINDATYFNSREQRFEPNPFFSGKVKDEDAVTTRDPQPALFNNDNIYEYVLLALEQDNFCDFEIQFEIIHNAIHSLLGGRAQHSLSSLDYTAFDPVFFLHHANTDRLWAIWQELQRFRNLPYNEADCAINLMRKPLEPFSDDNFNHGDLTNRYSRPVDTFDYRNHFGYEYDTLEFNHMNVQQLDSLLKRRQENGRVFAGFILHNIGMSAVVKFYICVPTGADGKKNCGTLAGVFSVLGGELEMPFMFDRLYKHDITRAARNLGLKLDNAANFELKVNIKALNGSYINANILPKPTIFFVPGTGERQEADGHVSSQLVRKNINALSPQEELSLLKAMAAMQADGSGDGYQSIASFHAIPPLCPNPSASDRHACCLHGMATFPHWHRLYTVQVEDSLRRHGSLVGIPYWDWTRQADALPGLLANPTYTDVYTGLTIDNPWYKASIDFENSVTERDVQGDLFKRGPLGWDTWLFKQALYALEQEDFCDFEIQFEITHNAVHSWIGGSKEKSMGHLHYASYDPAFYIHHSNTDRLWALWQALQQYRGHNPNEANCALEQMREPLRPFSFGAPYNLNPMTREFSKPEDAFDYEGHFHYEYDHLEFVGMSVSQLDAYIKEQQEHDRVFAGFLLKGFGSSALVNFDICDNNMNCFEGGYFTVLGGSAEMPWQFDRVFRYEITDQLKEHNLHHHDDYHFHVHVKGMDGTELDSSLIANPSVILELAHHSHDVEKASPNLIRRDLSTLTERDRQSLMAALYNLEHDDSKDGWASLASFHGEPAQCKDDHNTTIACCLHGMPTFPHWHRLFTVQVERALHRHGSSIAIPYWDWTLPITELPEIFTNEIFYDVWRDEVYDNPFARGYIPSVDAYTVRDVRPEIHLTTKDGSHSALLDLVLSALEQTDYCDFEVQFEVMHNAIHFLVGGHQTYALSSLEYSAYDPLFFIHHSFTDKVWAVWQQLQERRHLPSNKANCALDQMSAPMRPFNMEELNINPFTREHAVPTTLFDYQDLGYAYDNLNIGGYDLEGLEHLIADKQSRARVFAGFLLKGVKTSGSVVLNVCRRSKSCIYAGRFNLLGGPTEMPWAFDRLFKLDITHALEEQGLHPEDVFDADALFKLEVKVYDVEGQALSLHDVMPNPTIIFEAASDAVEDVTSTTVAGVGVRKDVSTLSVSEISNLREALSRVQEDQGPNGFQNIASFHGSPARCEHHGQPIACCLHGMANFPQWHRLFVKQFEDALTAQGAKIGIPYWDWTTAFTSLPSLVTEEGDNPFHHGTTHNGHQTSRAPRDQLFNDPELGSESFFYRQALLVFEQTDYCDFEVQYEITHNAIHSWTGGRSPYGMSTLEYTAYDPLFIIHHSNVDRQFAIWQALQKFRGLPYDSANCAIQKLRQPMRPFSDDSNINPVTRANARAIDSFDYDKLNYQYDNLNFHGMSISELNDVLEHRKQEDRIMAEFLLHGFGAGADVIFNLCRDDNKCVFAGTFAVLGGAIEMPWAFDRLFKYDVTNVFHKLNLRRDDVYHFEVEIVAVNGTKLDSGLIRPPSVQFIPGVKGSSNRDAAHPVVRSNKLVRKDINRLSLAEATNLRDALYRMQQDQGPNGFEAIAGFHGAPFKCPATGEDKYACCVHGMPMFPHWHRLHTVQFEQALRDHGALVGIPYWDWTGATNALPPLFADSSNYNPFYKYHISFENQDTLRDVQDYITAADKVHGFEYYYWLALGVLEEDNFCDFEVQYELLHNDIHRAIGGKAKYSMSTLHYSAFDPFFMIHHSSLDRIWIIWQELQKLRRKPFNSASCAGHVMDAPLHPFNYPEVNTNEFTRLHSKPSDVFNAHQLPYTYDKLELAGKDVSQINEDINRLHGEDRVYLGMVLGGSGASLAIEVDLLDNDGKQHKAAWVEVLGGEREMPWVYERLFKYDITASMKKAKLSTDKPVKAIFNSTRHDNSAQELVTEYIMLVERPAQSDFDIVVLPLGREIHRLPPKIILKRGTRVKFLKAEGLPISNVIKVDSYTSFHKCVIPLFGANKFAIEQVHDLGPGDHYFVAENVDRCKEDKRIQITIEDE